MEFFIKENLHEKSYFLTGKNFFFHRYADSGFKTKWTGFWKIPRKYLEYFAFKINGKWLSPKNCKLISYKGYLATHFYQEEEFEVEENIFVPKDFASLAVVLTIRNKLEKEFSVKFESEIAINIREKFENWHNRTYSIKVDNGKIEISSEKGNVIFTSIPKGKIELYPNYKDHYPNNEKQRCFIPGNYLIKLILPPKKSNSIIFVFGFGEKESIASKNLEQTISNLDELIKERKNEIESLFEKNKIKTNFENLEDLFRISLLGLNSLFMEFPFGKNLIAGLPWYIEFWGRDSLWSSLGLIEIGEFEKVKEILETFSKFEKNEMIPNFIDYYKNVSYNSIDSSLLFPIVFEKYVFYSKDLNFLKEKIEILERIFFFLSQRENENGFIYSNSNETWMDTIERNGYPIEIQALYIQSLISFSKLLNLLKDQRSSKVLKKAKTTLKNLKEFWIENEGFYEDSLGKRFFSINPIFLNLFDLDKNFKKSFSYIEKNFKTKFGISCISKKEEIFDSSSYHLGACWAWLLPIYLYYPLKVGNFEEVKRILNLIKDFSLKGAISNIPEVWNSQNGSLIVKKPLGREISSLSQAWNYGMLIYFIDRLLLGIDIDSFQNLITISPLIPNNFYIERRKRIGNDWINLKIEKKGNRINFDYSSKQNKKYKIIVKPKI